MALPARIGADRHGLHARRLFPALAGNLFVASSKGRQLLRVRFDPLDPWRVASTEPLLQDRRRGRSSRVAAGPDGAIYFATADSVRGSCRD